MKLIQRSGCEMPLFDCGDRDVAPGSRPVRCWQWMETQGEPPNRRRSGACRRAGSLHRIPRRKFHLQLGNRTFAHNSSTVAAASISAPWRAFSPPPSIPSDCSQDVTIPLWDWLYSLPLGSLSSPVEVDFAHSGCYQIDGQLWLRGFTDTTFNGNGATFKNTESPNHNETAGKLPMNYPEWCLSDSETTTVVRPAKDTYLESDTGARSDIMFDFEGGCDITLENMNIEEQNTDPPRSTKWTLPSSSMAPNECSSRTTLHQHLGRLGDHGRPRRGRARSRYRLPDHGRDNPERHLRQLRTGRVRVTEGNRISIRDNTMSGRTPQDLVDMEADWRGPTIANVAFVGNKVSSRYGWILASLSGATEYNIVVEANSFTGSSGMRIRIGSKMGRRSRTS